MNMIVIGFMILQKKLIMKTDSLDEADCYVLNTCHIREKATDKVYHDIGRVKKIFRNKKTNSNHYRMCCTSRGRHFANER